MSPQRPIDDRSGIEIVPRHMTTRMTVVAAVAGIGRTNVRVYLSNGRDDMAIYVSTLTPGEFLKVGDRIDVQLTHAPAQQEDLDDATQG